MKTQKPIPTKFYKYGQHPVACTVGELVDLLMELPRDLPIDDGWGNAPEVVVFNYGTPSMHLQLHEAD